MEVVNVERFEESFVIYFDGKPKSINAYTLATSIVSIADAIKAANELINPGYDVEVVVESFGDGSFKVKVATVFRSARNIFSKDNLRNIVLGVIASFVYQKTLAPESDVNVIVNSEEVVIEQGDKRIVIPREVHEQLTEIEKSEKITRCIGNVFDAAEADENLDGVGLTPYMEDNEPLIYVPRSKFQLLARPQKSEDEAREVIEQADLQISRAILERGLRKWEFVWRGIKISGPILDDRFFDNFAAHKITIAPGDVIRVRLKIYQSKEGVTGIFTNQRYEVLEVIEHVPRLKQQGFEDTRG